MKKLTVLFAAILSVSLFSCEKTTNLADINVDLNYNQTVTIPSVPGYNFGVPLPSGGVDLSFPAVPFATQSQTYVTEYNTSVEKIKKIDLKKMDMLVKSPDSLNFDFLDRVDIYVSSKTLPEVLVGYAENIPKGSKSLNLFTITSVNLKDYFVKDTMYMRMQAHINAVPPPGGVLETKTVFHMLANPLN